MATAAAQRGVAGCILTATAGAVAVAMSERGADPVPRRLCREGMA
jgi:hypothetical protein